MAIRIEPPITKEKLEQALALTKYKKQKKRSANLRKLFGKGTKGLDPMAIQKEIRNEWN